MKTFIAVAIFALVLSVLATAVVSAEETVLLNQPVSAAEADLTDSQINQDYPELAEDAGATPDQPLRYGLKRMGEGLALGLTFNKEKRAEKQLEIAQKRLLEMKKMIAKNKLQQAEKLQARYEERIQRANEILQGLQEDGSQAAILANAKNIAKLQNRIENHEMAIEALKNVIAEKNMTDEQKAKLEAVLESMENKTEAMKANAEQRQDKIKDRLRAVTNKSESEVDALLKNATNSELEQAREKIAARWITRTEDSLARINQKLNDERLKGINTSQFESFSAEVRAKLADAKAAYAAGNYEEALKILKPVNNYGRQLSQAVKFRNEARLQALKDVRDKEVAKLQVIKEKIEQLKSKIAGKVSSEISGASENETQDESTGQSQGAGKDK